MLISYTYVSAEYHHTKDGGSFIWVRQPPAKEIIVNRQTVEAESLAKGGEAE